MTQESQQYGLSGSFDLNYLYDLIFREKPATTGYLGMIYETYLDDSFHAGEIAVSAGFCGRKDDWKFLSRQWDDRLKKDGLAYFKSSEYKMLNGEFQIFRQYVAPLGRQKAARLREDLQNLVRVSSGIDGFGIVVPIDDYNAAIKLSGADQCLNPNPYYSAVQEVIFQIATFVGSKPGNNEIVFVHDDGNRFNEMHDVYKKFKEKNPKTARLLAGFQPMDDKKTPPLQLADMIANITLGIADEWMNSGRIKPKFLEMQSSIERLGVLDEEFLKEIVHSQTSHVI